MSNVKDFDGYSPTWCPGCGNWGIGVAVKTALVKLGLDPSQVALVFGIGCSGNMNDFVNAYAIHSLHGRAIPNAIGIKLANHKLPVIVIAGDGDTYGEGGNHFLHSCRGNHDITVIVHDNRVYGLTTGQVSPRAQKGTKAKSTPNGVIEKPLNPLTLAVTSGATFVAQAFAGDVNQMVEVICQAVAHRGFSFINILQPCVSFNKVNTHQYYLERVYKLPDGHNREDYNEALKKAAEIDSERFPLGVIYKVNKPTYTAELTQLKEKTLLEKARFEDFDVLIEDFA
jgi:2-oxoglutarate ferredoxin oxidoreductase subunit beta